MVTDEELLARNQGVIKEFREGGGVVAGVPFPIVLLTAIGARTGRRTTSPVAFGVNGGRVFVVGSKAGGPSNPAWFYNLRANPSVTVELGGRPHEARAVIAEGAERDRLYGVIKGQIPEFAEHEKSTDRTFPVVVLEGVPAPA